MAEPVKEKEGFFRGLYRTLSKTGGAGHSSNRRRLEYDPDAEQLPHGMQRLGHDADDQTYTYRNVQKPHSRYQASGPGVKTGPDVRISPKTKGGPAVEASTRRRRRRSTLYDVKGKGHEQSNSDGRGHEQLPLIEWPPSGVSSRDELPLGQAMELISRGVPAHKGHKRPITHASESYYGLYATTAGNTDEENDSANQHDSMTQLMTLRVQGSGPPTYPWETLEQPSFSFSVGCRPGTITLNAWVNKASVLPPTIALRDPGVSPREVALPDILKRLKELEHGLEDDDESQMYKGLYKRFLRDPEKSSSPHKRMEQQIMDLVMCLSSPDWIDFTNPRNQVVTKFIYDMEPENQAQYTNFFYQLLLSLELELRISSRLHIDQAKERLMGQIPPKIQWNLALARRWRDNVRVEAYGPNPEDVRLRFKLRKRQGRMLKRFAQLMKWPNLAKTEDSLKLRDREGTLVTVSSAAMAFFSGLVLPGPTFPFLMMNSLIDIDPDQATDHLALLTHMSPSCGFQYQHGYTYWTSTSIVGKVLAPTCREVAGWVGPARPSHDLAGSQIARIRSRRIRGIMTAEDVNTMPERSDPLGPAAEVYPVKEYKLLTPDSDDVVDTVRVERLNLKPVSDGIKQQQQQKVNGNGNGNGNGPTGPGWFDAEIQFAIDGLSWPFRLNYDVCFIHAWPCSDGPHPLFFDYVYTTVKADEVIHVRHWGYPSQKGGYGLSSNYAGSKNGSGMSFGQYGNGNGNSGLSTPVGGVSAGAAGTRNGSVGYGRAPIPPLPSKMMNMNIGGGGSKDGKDDDEDAEKVLVIEAFGVKDNEVLARAWCAHWGLSAVVVDIGKTCMACGIREAYAATLTVVIIIEDLPDGMDA